MRLWRVGAVGPSMAGTWGCRPHCHVCSVTCGHRHCSDQEVGVLCTASPASTVFWSCEPWFPGQRAGIAGTTSNIPLFCIICVSNPLNLKIYRYVEFSCILLCWMEADLLSCILLSVDWSGETKIDFSLHHVSGITPCYFCLFQVFCLCVVFFVLFFCFFPCCEDTVLNSRFLPCQTENCKCLSDFSTKKFSAFPSRNFWC